MQLSLALENPCPSHIGPERTFLDTRVKHYSFGKGLEWHDSYFNNFSAGVPAIMPIINVYGIGCAVLPDFRGFNGQIFDARAEKILPICERPALFKTTRAVDAIIVEQGTSVLAFTKDCPVGVIVFKQHKAVAVVHCARDAMIIGNGIIHRVCSMMAPFEPEDVSAYICHGIGVDDFEHKADKDKNVIAQFIATRGQHVVKHGEHRCLDLPRIIEADLKKWGILQVGWDGINVYRDARFYSRCRGDVYSNCALVDTTNAFS